MTSMKRAGVILFLLLVVLVVFAGIGAQSALAVQLDVPSWLQSDSRWAGLHLDGSSYTMGGSGCAVTSCAMVAAYYGSAKDPGQLCRALGAKGGLDSQGRIYWEKVPGAAGGTISYVGRWDYSGSADLSRINRELDNGFPVIAEVRRSGSKHYVVLTGRDGSIYSMNDPGYAGMTTLNSRYGSPGAAIKGIRVYRGEHEEPEEGLRFTDVGSSHPYFAAIEALAGRGIVSGYVLPGGGARFRPDNPLMRAQFAKIICGAGGLVVDENLTSPFTDMGADNPQDLYPHDYVAAAAEAGIIQGRTPTEFVPWSNLTRGQMVTLVVRSALSLFPDSLAVPDETWAGAVPTFDPAHDPYMRLAEYNGLLDGLVRFLGPDWNPWAACSRGEAAQVVWNWLSKLQPAPEALDAEGLP